MIKREVHAHPDEGKGWLVGPWDSALPVAVGWADRGVMGLRCAPGDHRQRGCCTSDE